MTLTETQRAAIKRAIATARSERLHATLRATTHVARITPELLRETQGPNPWDTFSAPGRDVDDALNTLPLVLASVARRD